MDSDGLRRVPSKGLRQTVMETALDGVARPGVGEEDAPAVAQSVQNSERAPLLVGEEGQRATAGASHEGASTVKGLGVFATAVFLVGEMAGSGVLALGQAVEAMGWIGLVTLPFCALALAYTGAVLAENWSICQHRYPALRAHVRYPYPLMGALTFGTPGRLLVTVSIFVTSLGSAVVFVIMTAQNIHSIALDHLQYGGLPFCWWIVIIAASICPLTFFGTPKNFKFLGVLAMLATTAAITLLMVLMARDVGVQVPDVRHAQVTPLGFATAFGTLLYAFGGHPLFPTLQTDMKQPQHFRRSCYMAYVVLVFMYFPVAAAGYFVYGSKVKANVLLSVTPSPALAVVQSLITAHLVCGFVIIINPICQELEEILRVPASFGLRRVALRSGVCGVVLVLALLVPQFGAILSLVGGSTMGLLAFVCPPLFHFRLVLGKSARHWTRIKLPLYKTVLLTIIMVIGILGGLFSTYSSAKDLLSPGEISAPCFGNMSVAVG